MGAINSASCRRVAVSLLLAVMALPACHARKDFVEPDIGWHAAGFNTVFGRLQRVAGATPESPSVWVLRFGSKNDSYQGEFALTAPAEAPNRLAGYAGGEAVEIKGHLLDRPTTDAYNGRWYVVDSIQMWTSYKQ